MGLAEFTMAALALLVTPGPTNTLLLIGGSERGWLRALRLIPAELAGYFGTVLPLALLGDAVLASVPGLRAAVALLAGLWVAWLALKLWRLPAPGSAPQSVTARTVLTTTLLNPKALIFGLVLIPDPDRMAQHLALFAALIVAVAAGWAALGAGLARPGARSGGTILPLLRRVAAIWLAFISATLIAKGLSA